MKAVKITPAGDITAVDIENTLEALQAAVGGYIETVSLAPDCALVVDEEGRLKCKPFNLAASLLCVRRIVGTALVCGVDFDRFTDLPEVWEQTVKYTISERRKAEDVD